MVFRKQYSVEPYEFPPSYQNCPKGLPSTQKVKVWNFLLLRPSRTSNLTFTHPIKRVEVMLLFPTFSWRSSGPHRWGWGASRQNSPRSRTSLSEKNKVQLESVMARFKSAWKRPIWNKKNDFDFWIYYTPYTHIAPYTPFIYLRHLIHIYLNIDDPVQVEQMRLVPGHDLGERREVPGVAAGEPDGGHRRLLARAETRPWG